MKDTASPTILGIDTSAQHCGVALVVAGEIVADLHEPMDKGQAERLFPMIDEVLADARIDFDDLDAIGVGTGPGNFTGIRISISAARGLALSLGIPAVGVSLFDVLAFQSETKQRPLLLSLKAARDRVYLQTRKSSVASDISMSTLDALPAVEAGTICIGAYGPQIAQSLGIEVLQASMAPAAAIGMIATSQWETTTERPAPLYVRSADAVPPSDPTPVILPDDA